MATVGAAVHQPALYDLASVTVLLTVLLVLRRRPPSFDGRLIAVFVAWYGTGRFVEDFFRIDETHGTGLTGSQWSSVAAVAVATYVLVVRRRPRTSDDGPNRVPEAPDPIRRSHPMSRHDHRALMVVTLVLALVAAACGGSDTGSSGARQRDAVIAAQVASYDLVAGRTGRFIVGIFGSDRARTVAYGTVTFQFSPVNDGAADPAEPGPLVEASFLPIPGQDIDPDQPGPRLVGAAEATGVYGAPEVSFDHPGFWPGNGRTSPPRT